ncbi:hypothetical protein [Chryseosolibacter indicus]|uniref:Uncharacterized protein n=1 Tax=Chryseosolibacter indicus TaxID=2782351 RepID=A0ABS5VQ32_9BACT|nr:hypothetical protein [Chryseosolibacter indicus]MBT1703557.1 hypothetical protein [Chryseosolibacter indicus]
MPVATILSKKDIHSSGQQIIDSWAEEIGIESNDITINIITDFSQFGNSYPIMVNLYLPTIWNEESVKQIQLSLIEVLSKHLKTEAKDIFIMTMLISSGHVVDKGQIGVW